MKVSEQNVEKELLGTIKGYWQNNEAQRCLYLRTSQLKTDNQEWFSILTTETEEFFHDEAGRIFRCNDNDVFILTRYISNKSLTTLLTHLSHKLMPVPFDEELASLFEINVSWPELKSICERKIDTIAAAKIKKKKEKEKQEEAEYKKRIMNTKANEDMVATLPMRRRGRKNSTILVVEDDIFSQRLVKNSINKKHYVVTAKDGNTALNSYVQEAPDILFLDIGLPDISGHDILKKIFEIDKDAYIVMLSGNGDRKNILRAVEQGAKGFIGKPFTKDKLSQYIQKSPFIQEKHGT